MSDNRSKHADSYLKGLKGLEIGGAAHNQFYLDTLNVDYTDEFNDYAQLQTDQCGSVLKVDIVANAWDIPVEDKSFDFVISSHVIEHLWDPIEALQEWKRIARKYIYVIVPQRDASEYDVPLPLTTLEEIEQRHLSPEKVRGSLGHVSRWTSATFVEMVRKFGFTVLDVKDPDDKVGNGFAVVIWTGGISDEF